ncbi:hypothetical protein EVAR_36376_1 [Eumeta japonica]|uniref:Uncharacterized protein n=1 Tax=Eumeta variegata TaxID=151549 RepID=A0A4C1W8C1_EUMVA|nr:hypothetical protein EVAR_36376_1 [Eumeta japonica]
MSGRQRETDSYERKRLAVYSFSLYDCIPFCPPDMLLNIDFILIEVYCSFKDRLVLHGRRLKRNNFKSTERRGRGPRTALGDYTTRATGAALWARPSPINVSPLARACYGAAAMAHRGRGRGARSSLCDLQLTYEWQLTRINALARLGDCRRGRGADTPLRPGA